LAAVVHIDETERNRASTEPTPVDAAPAPEDAPAGPALGSRRMTGRRAVARRRGRVAVIVTAALVAGSLLTLGIVSDLHVRSELRQTRSSLEVTRSQLVNTLTRLATTEATLASTTEQRDTLQSELATTSQDLAGAESNLSNADQSLHVQGIDIATLHTCLAGVEQALNQIAVGNASGAVSSISGVASSCQALQGQGPGGPVFPFDFPDPDVIRVGSTYYGYATNSAAGNIQMIQSTDLAHWTLDGNALPRLAPWARPGFTWAPGVFELDGQFVLYYAALSGTSGTQCISVAVAADPQGPFIDASTAPLVCQQDLGGSIDPSPFLDAAGTPYLVWKSQGTSGRPPVIWSQQLAPGGTALSAGDPSALLEPSQSWEAGIVEGPFVYPSSGRYYLFYSANNWDGASYAIGVAVCDGPKGPCSKPLDHPLLASQTGLSGPVGPSLFSDVDGATWIAFHAWLPAAVGYPNNRLLFLRPVTFPGGMPEVSAT